MEDYEIKVSDFVKKLMWQVMKKSTRVVQGFILFEHRTIVQAHFDPEGCEQLLKDMVINKENVIRYLRRKYIGHKMENGVNFPGQVCIQKAFVKEDGSVIIYINKSEPHKIITDTFHVLDELKTEGFEFNYNIKYFINQVQIAYQDTLLYNELLKEFGFQIPSPARIYAKQLLVKYGKLENVAKIKKRSVKRKFCRYYAKIGKITWTDLRKIINIDDFSDVNVRRVCNEIRADAKERGVKVDF